MNQIWQIGTEIWFRTEGRTEGRSQNYIPPTLSGDKKQLARWYFLYLLFLTSGNLGLLSMVLILDINLLSSFLKSCSLILNVFVFILRKNPVNGGSLHWIQPKCADAYNKLPSMVGSQPIICFLILDFNKYSQVGSSLAHWIFVI